MPGTGVHFAWNPCSHSPESMFTIPGIRVHDALEWLFTFGWNQRSPCPGIPSHAHNELTDVLRRRRSAWAPVLAAIVLGCDEVAVLAQKRSGCGNGRNLGQRLAA